MDIDVNLVDKAVQSLKTLLGKQQEGSLLESRDEFLTLILQLRKIPEVKNTAKPIAIPLPHPIYTCPGVDVCLFVKDLPDGGSAEVKARLGTALRGLGVGKVISVKKLRTKYESYEARQKLLASYDLFLADTRVLPVLPKLLGAKFFKKKKQPAPLEMRRGSLEASVQKALEHTYYYPSKGSCISVRVGRCDQSAAEIYDNLRTVVKVLPKRVPTRPDNVTALFLKLATSISLPIYQRLPENVDMSVLKSGALRGEKALKGEGI